MHTSPHAQCGCKSLDYNFTIDHRKCDTCSCSKLAHYGWWNKWVANPIKNYGALVFVVLLLLLVMN